jgi:pimeloyl-ACP methyl ester carboxylesterase
MAVAILRMVVRNKAFWEKGLKSAFFDPRALTPELLYRYRLPGLVRGWESGMLLFLRARLSGKAGEAHPNADREGTLDMESWASRQTNSGGVQSVEGVSVGTAAGSGACAQPKTGGSLQGNSTGFSRGVCKQGPQEDSLLERFHWRLQQRNIPLVILHGEQDNLVPIGNSCRMSAVLGVPLIKISDCGHTPAEEVPQCFVQEVSRFVHQVQKGRAVVATTR